MDYVTKPFHVEDLKTRLMRVARDVDLHQENELLREQLRTRPGFGGLIGVSQRMQRRRISRVHSFGSSVFPSSTPRAELQPRIFDLQTFELYDL